MHHNNFTLTRAVASESGGLVTMDVPVLDNVVITHLPAGPDTPRGPDSPQALGLPFGFGFPDVLGVADLPGLGRAPYPDQAPYPDRAPYPDPRQAAWSAFAMAAVAAVQLLNTRLGLDLWMVTEVDGDRQTVVAAAGDWVGLAAPGTAFSWQDSFCLRMLDQRGPTVAPDVLVVPAYAQAAAGIFARVRAYVGVPLMKEDGTLFGTLCAFAAEPQPASLADSLDLVQLVGQMLATILAREQVARASSEDATAAVALAGRDRLTGLRNRHGWESALTQEDARHERHGSTASVLVLDLDDLKRTNDRDGHPAGDDLLERCAAVLTGASRPGDALARLGGDEFGIVAIECDVPAARSVLSRVRRQLRAADVAASAGSATRRDGEHLADTWRRADEAMYRDKRRRKRSRSAALTGAAG